MWGQGWGVAFGGSGLVPLASPLSSVGDPAPVSFDFTTDPDAPLPGAWEFFRFSSDGATAVGSAEPNPPAFYRVAGGLALWDYKRSPNVGVPFVEEGVAASPSGVLQGPNGELGVAFVRPTDLLDADQGPFSLEVTAAVRASDDGASYIGARVRAAWASGVWTVPVACEAVRVTAGAVVVLATGVLPPDLRDPIDVWASQRFGEVVATVVDGTLTASLNGVVVAHVSVPTGATGKPVVVARILQATPSGGTFSVPAIAGVRLQTLRALAELGPGPQVVGRASLVNPPTSQQVALPVGQLLQAGLVRRKGPAEFEFTQDVQTDTLGTGRTFNAGDRVTAAEPFGGQLVTPCVVDLHFARARRRTT